MAVATPQRRWMAKGLDWVSQLAASSLQKFSALHLGVGLPVHYVWGEITSGSGHPSCHMFVTIHLHPSAPAPLLQSDSVIRWQTKTRPPPKESHNTTICEGGWREGAREREKEKKQSPSGGCNKNKCVGSLDAAVRTKQNKTKGNMKQMKGAANPHTWCSATHTQSGIYPEGPRPHAPSKDSQSNILSSLTKCENGGWVVVSEWWECCVSLPLFLSLPLILSLPHLKEAFSCLLGW